MAAAAALQSEWAKVENSDLFRIGGPEIELCEVLERLAELVTAEPDESDDWLYLGEHGECSLPDFLIGAYWALSEWHGGQNSPEYRALCAVGNVYKPNMANGPEPDSGEQAAYEAVDRYFAEQHK